MKMSTNIHQNQATCRHFLAFKQNANLFCRHAASILPQKVGNPALTLRDPSPAGQRPPQKASGPLKSPAGPSKGQRPPQKAGGPRKSQRAQACGLSSPEDLTSPGQRPPQKASGPLKSPAGIFQRSHLATGAFPQEQQTSSTKRKKTLAPIKKEPDTNFVRFPKVLELCIYDVLR